MFEEFVKRCPPEMAALPSRKSVRAAKKELLARIEREEAAARPVRRLTKRAVMVPVMAAVFAAGTVTAAAAGISVLVSRYFDNSEVAREMLRSDIFHDEDENVSIDVEEFISDGMAAYASVRYTALTDEGKKWIEGYDFDSYPKLHAGGSEGYGGIFKGCLYFMPRGYYDSVNGGDQYKEWQEGHYIGNFSFNCAGMTDRDTENERYFMLMLELDKKDTAGTEMALFYPLTDGAHTADVSTAEGIKEKLCMISGRSDGKYYAPVCVRISQLSATIYGEFTRDDIYRGDGGRLKVKNSEYENLRENTCLVTRDGRKLYFGSGEEPYGAMSDDNSRGSYILLSGVFRQSGENGGHITVDPDDVAGIQIEDDYYSFD